MLALVSDKLAPGRIDCVVLAGKSTLNRLEHSPAEGDSRYHKISHDPVALESLFVDLFLEAHKRLPKRITLDLDATDDPVHGSQEDRFFHGYYGCYCYLPLYVLCGRHVLVATLRPANIDASCGAVEKVARIIGQIRRRWPKVKVVLRADNGFAREALMAWCEAHKVDCVFGLVRNERLVAEIEAALAEAAAEHERNGAPARRFPGVFYATRKTWSRHRRVVAKVEHLAKGANPRFIVTSLKPEEIDGRRLYDKVGCARGEMENRIKGEGQPWRQWRRVSAANQLDLLDPMSD